jgi:hypothetical protein
MLGIDIGYDINLKEFSVPFRRQMMNQNLRGFEQINDNLFARKENRFLVFNDAGLSEWPPESETKLGSIINDINLVRSTSRDYR